MKTKVCTKCGGEPKPLSEYYKSKNHKYGVHSWCISCHKSYRKINKDKYKDNYIKYKKTYRQRYLKKIGHTEKSHAIMKDNIKKNRKLLMSGYQKKYRNKPDVKKRRKQYEIGRYEIKAKTARKFRLDLKDWYIKAIICASSNHLCHRDIPQNLVEVKRLQVKIHRQLRG